MGNNKSVDVNLKTVEHSRFGQIKVSFEYVEDDDENVEKKYKMHLQTPVMQYHQFDKWKRQLSKINDQFGKGRFLVPESYEFQKVTFCSDPGIAKIVYLYYGINLFQQISNRKSDQNPFTQPEIWFILYTLIQCGYKFQKDNQTIGDVHPRNILFDKNGSLVILTKFSIPKQKDNFEKIIEDKYAETFLASQQIEPEYLAKCEYNLSIQKSLAEVFCVGLTILSAGTLQRCYDVYNRSPNLKINQQRLNVLINSFSKRYSPYLTAVLKQMLEINPQQRVHYKQILSVLIEYKQDILNIEFDPEKQQPSSIGSQQSNSQNDAVLEQKVKMIRDNDKSKLTFQLQSRQKQDPPQSSTKYFIIIG